MGIATYYRQKTKNGFTIVELLVVVIVLATLAAIVFANYNNNEEGAIEKAEATNLQNMASAVKTYLYKNNTYPPDGNGTIPNVLQPYISSSNWPPKPAWPFPNAHYSFDAWSINPASGGAIDTYQMSIRFCYNDGGGNPVNCNALPPATWSNGFTSYSAYYWCISGYCRPYRTQATNYTGYCINCANNQGIKYSGEP